MKPIILINEDKHLRFHERLALFLKSDMTIRACSVSGLPESVIQSSTNASLLKRALSPHYKKLALVQLMDNVPVTADASLSASSGADLSSLTQTCQRQIEEFDFFTTALDLMQTKVNETMAAAKAAESGEASVKPKTGGKNEVSLKNSIYDELRTRWAKSGILSLASAAALVDRDISDPENACSFREAYDAWDGTAGSNHVNTVLTSVFVGAKDGGAMPTALKLGSSDYFQYLEYTYLNASPKEQRTLSVERLMTVLSGSPKKEKMSDEVDMYTRLTVLNSIFCAPKMASVLRDSIDLSNDKYSDQKELDLLLHECSRVKSLNAARLFASMQGWIALMQMAMRPFVQPIFLEYMKSRLPHTSAVYDVDGLISKFMGLRVGEFTADVIGSDMQVTSANYGGKDYPVLHLAGQTIKPEEIWGYVAGLYKVLIPNLHTLLAHSKLWEVYEEGSRLLGSKPITVTSKKIDLDNGKVAFVQAGVLKGDTISDLDDTHLSAIMEWGVNRFNSSARTLVRLNDTDSEDLLPPYHYGAINYREYLADRTAILEKMASSKKGVSGHSMAAHNMPMFPVRYRRTMDSVRGIVYDRSLLDKGPVSMLPIQPSGMVSIAKAFNPSMVRKQKIGSYETKLDNLEFEFLHAEPFAGEVKDQKKNQSALFLAEALGLSPQILNVMVGSNTNVLNRFLSYGDKGEIACKAITIDKLFIDQANCYFYIPSTTFFKDIRILDIMPEFMETSADALWHSTRSIKIGHRRLLQPSSDSATYASLFNQVMGRISGSSMYLDAAFHLPIGQDDLIDWFSVSGSR